MPKQKLQEYLASSNLSPLSNESPDCSIVPLRNSQYLVSTTDFFYPLVTDPYLQGQIGCCNVLSDLYSLGIQRCDNMLMTLTVSWDMTDEEQSIVTTQVMKGFCDMAALAGTQVTGGQTILNPCPIIGGVAMSVVGEEELIRPCGASPGDVIVLTKPIGTQVAVNLYEWCYSKRHIFEKLSTRIEEEKVLEIFAKACGYMASLNRGPAGLMHKYRAKACTDVTGFGILGHAQNLASVQHADVDFRINRLPIIAGVMSVEKQVRDFRLVEGFSAETSGGLMIVLPRDEVEGFLREFNEVEGRPAWIIGDVVEGSRKAVIENPEILEV